jgi:hypothetical protein
MPLELNHFKGFYSFDNRQANYINPVETELVELHILCIKIGIVLVLHFNPLVEASAGGL